MAGLSSLLASMSDLEAPPSSVSENMMEKTERKTLHCPRETPQEGVGLSGHLHAREEGVDDVLCLLERELTLAARLLGKQLVNLAVVFLGLLLAA